jgi:aminopeptidase N
MIRALVSAVVLFAAVAAEAAVHHEAQIAYRHGDGTLTLTDRIRVTERSRLAIGLAPWMKLTDVRLGGRDLTPKNGALQLPGPGPHEIEITAEGRVPALTSRGGAGVAAGDGGLYLPSGSGWLPDTGDAEITYRLAVTTEAPWRAVTTGWLVSERVTADGHEAVIEAARAMESPSLFAGPYRVTERESAGVRLRTYFHAEAAGLADAYLDQAARFIRRFAREIGPYPYGDFHIVSAPLPVGLGFPSLTYVGRRVLHLPFMQGRSLAHEILHSWWGNAVGVDYAHGNWAEGLTTYMADHALAEDGGKEMRLGWLRDFAALPGARRAPVRAFVTKRHRAAQVIGYGKVAMIFHMLKAEVGDAAFAAAIRQFYKDHAFKRAGWKDIEATFAAAAGRPLAGFFRQWLDRADAPEIRIAEAKADGGQVRLTLTQGTPAYSVGVPVALTADAGMKRLRLEMDRRQKTFALDAGAAPARLAVDPDFDLFRLLLAGESPPILRDVALAENPVAAVVGGDRAFRQAAMALLERLTDAEPKLLAAGDLPGTHTPALLIGTDEEIGKIIAERGLHPAPETAGTARAWAARTASDAPVYLVAARDADALAALMRGLPHYGRRGWVVFDGARAIDKGQWPADASPLVRTFGN